MVEATGWTHEEIGRLPMPAFWRYLDFFDRNPPVAAVARWYLGVTADAAPQKPTMGQLMALARA